MTLAHIVGPGAVTAWGGGLSNPFAGGSGYFRLPAPINIFDKTGATNLDDSTDPAYPASVSAIAAVVKISVSLLSHAFNPSTLFGLDTGAEYFSAQPPNFGGGWTINTGTMPDNADTREILTKNKLVNFSEAPAPFASGSTPFAFDFFAGLINLEAPIRATIDVLGYFKYFEPGIGGGVAAIAITNPGSSYVAGDQAIVESVFLGQGAIVTIDAVSGLGAVTALHVSIPGVHYSTSDINLPTYKVASPSFGGGLRLTVTAIAP